MEPFDSNEDIFVISAHDPTMRDIIEFFPGSLDAWKEKGWKDTAVWEFADPNVIGYRLS